MIQRRLRAGAELRDDSLRQHFSQLHAPLVERVDVPDHALREHDVLVERDQLAQALPASVAEAESCSTADYPGTSDAARANRASLRFALPRRLAEGQRFALREHVGEQHVVVLPSGLSVSSNAMKSHGMSRVPWWIS